MVREQSLASTTLKEKPQAFPRIMTKAETNMANSKQLRTPTMIALVTSLVAVWAGMLVDSDSVWYWVLLAVQVVAVIVSITFLVRLVRAQRDEYWTERGRDPRNPTRPGSAGGS